VQLLEQLNVASLSRPIAVLLIVTVILWTNKSWLLLLQAIMLPAVIILVI